MSLRDALLAESSLQEHSLSDPTILESSELLEELLAEETGVAGDSDSKRIPGYDSPQYATDAESYQTYNQNHLSGLSSNDISNLNPDNRDNFNHHGSGVEVRQSAVGGHAIACDLLEEKSSDYYSKHFHNVGGEDVNDENDL